MTDNVRILCKDNFDREGPGHDERFVLYPMPEADAIAICRLLNKHTGDHGSDYYCIAPLDYKLRKFEP